MSKSTTPTPLQPDTCSTREAGKMLGVSLRTVQVWVDSGLLEGWRTVGGHRRITAASVERLMRERTLDRPSASTAGRSNAPQRDGLSLLVVEDDHDLLDLYRNTIDGWGLPLQLYTATNGFEGLLQIGEMLPDLLITDLNMPGINGFEMLRSLRIRFDVTQMAIVVVTGLDKADIYMHGGLAADVEILGKPVPFARLKALIEELLVKKGKLTATASVAA
jgi:excisionase family DNA binding protein